MSEAELARLEERIEALKDRVSATDERLGGFPQVYALRAEVERVHRLLDTIRTDHVQRSEFKTLSDLVIANGTRITYLYGGFAVVSGIAIAVAVKLFTS